MLARKYDNYAWQQQQVEQEQQPRRAPRHQGDNRVALGRAILTAVIVLATYMFVVWRSEAVVLSGQQLLQLERQEQQLIAKNNELKIEVEQLKGPERIIGLAQQRLGMNVARSNIYVKSGQAAKNSNSMTVKSK